MNSKVNNERYDFVDVFKHAKKVVLSDKDQVVNGVNPKSPYGKWEDHPADYTGFNDPKYGTAVVCDYIPHLNKHLVVIDLDSHENKGDIPMDTMRKCTQDLMKQTYTVKTGSGGYHIYLLSTLKPTAKQPRANIDYQANTGKGEGKYVVSDYIYNIIGNKVHYKKLKDSPDIILNVENSDDVLNKLISDLESEGCQINPINELTSQIANIISNNLRKGHRNDFALAISGYLRKEGFKIETTLEIMRAGFKEDEELQERLKVVEQTYNKDINSIIGWNGLKDYLNELDLNELKSLVVGNEADNKGKILNLLARQKEPSIKLLADYINNELTLYKDSKVLKYYERRSDGTITEIDYLRLEAFMNDAFGINQISTSKCKRVLDYITNHLNRNYNILMFNNGFYNTANRKFNTNMEELREIPKLSLPFNWNNDAKPGRIGELIDEILDNPKYPNNKELWFKAVGHAFIGGNRIGRMVIVQGESGTGKSTLTTILKRIFTGNYSEIKTQTIVKNDRFTLHSLIGKAINIDDDISNGILKGIGNLNTIVTGNGLQVEIKGENSSILAEAEQIPKLFANGNTLPPLIGTGMERRLLFVHADNQISYEKRDDHLQTDILSGKYDDGIEWLIYTCINLYLDNKDQPITTKEEEQTMRKEYDFKAYPVKEGINEIYELSYEDKDFIPINDVHRHIKNWCIHAHKSGRISNEHLKPSNTTMRKAMDQNGFNTNRVTVNQNKVTVYESIRLKDNWKDILEPEIREGDQTMLTST